MPPIVSNPLLPLRMRGRLLRTISAAAFVVAMAAPPAEAQLVRLRGGLPAAPSAAAGAGAGSTGVVRSTSMREALASQQTTQQQASEMRSYVLAARQAATASGPRATPTDGISVNGLYPIVSIRQAMAAMNAGNVTGAGGVNELLVAARAANDPTGRSTWDGAGLPTVDATNTKVEIVQNQSRAILSWDRFDIGAGTTLNFKQQQNGVAQPDWIAVNRVVGSADPTTILGKLTADGQVYILNSNGVIFGKGSQVNLRSLVASSLELGNYAPLNAVAANTTTTFKISGLQDRNVDFLNNGPFSAQANGGLGGAPTAVPALFLSPRVEAQPGTLNPDGTVTTGPTGTKQYLPSLEGDVIVDPGATITAATGGSIILAAPKVENAGVLTATEGQVSLIGGRLIAFKQLTGEAGSDDPNVRGLYLRAVTVFNGSNQLITDPLLSADAERADGSIVNRGLIESRRGYLALVTTERGSILNEGLLASTTSVSRNGKIALYGGRVTIGGATNANAAGAITILPDDNSAQLADGTLVAETIPQGSDAEPANFKRSQIEIGTLLSSKLPTASLPNGDLTVAFGSVAATNLTLGSNSLILAPNANLTNANSAAANGSVGILNSSVTIGENATIDVAGLKDVAADLGRNFVTVTPVKRNELRDTPNYREVAIGDNFTLNGTTLTVDVRRSGVRADGVKWVGSPLIEAGSIASQIPVTVAELMTEGGDVNFAVNGFANRSGAFDVTIGKGAKIDFSGGWLRYDSANVATSKLVTSDGRIVDIGNADPNDNFVSVYGGFNDTQSRFGIATTYTNPIVTSARTEAGYDEGRDAGSLLIQAPTSSFNGAVFGNAFAGAQQAATAAKPSSTRTAAAGDPRKLQAKATELPSGGYFSLSAPGGSDIVVFNGTLGSVQSGLAQTLLSDVMLSSAGLSALVLDTPGSVTFAGTDVDTLNLSLTPAQILSGVEPGDLLSLRGASVLNLAPGGILNVRAGRTIRVDGSILAPSGTINLATTNTVGGGLPLQNAAGNGFRSDDDFATRYAVGAPTPRLLDILVGGTLSTAGLWVNDYLGGDASFGKGNAWINGGSIALTVAPSIFVPIGSSAATAQKAADLSGSIEIASGSLLDVSAGGYVGADQSFDLTGSGGNVALVNETVYARLSASNRLIVDGTAVGGSSLPVYGANQSVGFAALAPSGFYSENLVPSLVPDKPLSRVSIADGALVAFGFSGSGTFKLTSPDIAFGADAGRANATSVGLDFLSKTGFGALDLTSNRSLIVSNLFNNGTNYNSAFRQTASFLVRSGETLDLTQTLFPLITARQDVDALLGLETGSVLRSLAALKPVAPPSQAAFDRRAVNLTIGGLSELVVEQGGTIVSAPTASITTTKLVNAGTISLPGGSIRQIDLTGLDGRTVSTVARRSLSDVLGGPLVNGGYLETALNNAGVLNPVTGSLATNAELFTISAGSSISVNRAAPSLGPDGRSERFLILLGVGDEAVGIDLRPGSVTDLSGISVLDPRDRFVRNPVTGLTSQVRTGAIFGGGSITSASGVADDGGFVIPVTRQFNAQPGAKIDISGTRATFDVFVASTGYVERDAWTSGGQIAALGGGSLAGAFVNAFGGYADDGGIFAATGAISAGFATPEALGGTIEWLRPTLRAVDQKTVAQNVLYADAITASGFDTLIARAGMVFDGRINLRLDKALIVTPNVTVSGAIQIGGTTAVSAVAGTVASISAPYIRFESAASALGLAVSALPPRPVTPGEVSFTAISLDAAGRPRTDLSLGIDFVGTNYFDRTIGTLNFTTPGDIRFTGVDARTAAQINAGTGTPLLSGEFVSFGDTLFDAGRVYATTGTGNLQAFVEAEAKGVAVGNGYGPYRILAAENRTLTFGNSYINRATPLSAGSYLSVEAGQIFQNGHLAAPIGRLEIGTREAVTSGALARDATSKIEFGSGSLTTIGGGSTPVPYGTTLDLKEYFFTPYSLAPLTVTPVGQLAIRGQSIDVAAGATIDLKGGGDLFAYEFVSGVGGSRDVLSRTNTDAFSSNDYDAITGIGYQYADKRQVYAIIPKNEFNAIAPFDPVYSADYGSKGPVDIYGANAGLSVFLDGSGDVPAGEYVLLPAHYALLDGKNGIHAYRLVENVNQAAPAVGDPQTLLDGSVIVSGNYGYAGTALRDSTIRSFSVQSRDTFAKSSRIETTGGSAFIKAAAARAGGTIPRLPIDAARLILSPLTELKIAGLFDTTTVAGAKGSQVDITGDRIIVASALTNGQPTPSTPGQLTLIDSALSNLNADSLFIGGTRVGNANGTTDLRIDANTITVRNGVNLAAPEILLAVGNQQPDGALGASSLTIETGARLVATGTLADPTAADYLIRSSAISSDNIVTRPSGFAVGDDASGAGSVIRLANGPERLIARTGDAADDNTLQAASLTIGAAVLTGDGARAGNIAIETSRNFAPDEAAVLDAKNIALSGDTIIFNGSAKTSVVRSALLTTLSSADRLTLRSANAIQFGDAATAYPLNVGGYVFNDLVIDAPQISVIQAAQVNRNTNVVLNTKNFRWFSSATALPSCIAFTCGRANTNLTVNASNEIAFGNGTLRTLNVGGTVRFGARNGIFYEGTGRLDVHNASLSLVTPFIADRASVADPRAQVGRSDFTFASNAGIVVTAPLGAAIPALADIAGNRAPGARLTFDTSDARTKVAGQVLDISINNALIEASAGTIDLRAQRNLKLTGTATLAAPGFTKRFGDALDFVTVAASGGVLNLAAKTGNITFVQGTDGNGAVTRATLISDTGAAAGSAGDALKGAAGAINLIASVGGIESLNPVGMVLSSFDPIINPGVTGSRLGDFTFDSGRSAFDLATFLNGSGNLFGGNFTVRSSSGDLTIGNQQTLRAESVSLTADGGIVALAGRIDTSGINVNALKPDGTPKFTLAEAAKERVAGGKVELYGQAGVLLAASAVIDTHTTGYADGDARSARAGDVTLGIGNAPGAAIVVASGAKIDVSASRVQANLAAGYTKDTGRFIGETAKDPGTLADRTVYRFVEADVGGKLTLRAPLIGAAINTVDIRLPMASAFVGADEVQIAAVRRYDLNALVGSLGISAGTGNDIILDPSAGYNLATPFSGNLLSSDFVTASGLPSIPNFIRNFTVSAADQSTSFAGFRLRPDVELVSSGAISLNSNWNLAAATVDQNAAFNAGLFDIIVPLSTTAQPVYSLKAGRESDLIQGFGNYKGADFLYRVGGRATGEAPLIDFRARGDVTISRSINDGFFVFRDRSDAAFINYQLGGGDRTFNPALAVACSIAAESNNCGNVVPYDPNILPVDRNYLSVRISIANAIGGTLLSEPTIHSPYSAAANNAAALGTALDSVKRTPVGASLEFAELFPTLSTGAMRSSDIAISAGSDARLSANPYHVDVSTGATARVVDGVIGTNGQPERPEYRLQAALGKASIGGSNLQLEFGSALVGLEDYNLADLINVTDPGTYNVDTLDRDSFAILNWGAPSQGSNKFAADSCALASATCATGFFDGRQIVGTKAQTLGVIAPLGQILDFLEKTKTEYLKRVADGRITRTLPALSPLVTFGTGVVPVQTVVRTGTGSINIAAAGNVDLRDGTNIQYRNPNGSKGLSIGLQTEQVGGTSVYTAGERVAAAPLTGRFADGSRGSIALNSRLLTPVVEDVNAAPTPYAVSGNAVLLAHRGGDVGIRAGGNVLGRSDEWSVAYRSANATAIRTGTTDISPLSLISGGIGTSSQLWRVGSGSEFGIAAQYFTAGVGALGGGNVTINAAGDVRDLTVALDTSTTAQTLAGSTTPTLVTFGSGNLAIKTGQDLQAGQYDIASGQARVEVGDSVTELANTVASLNVTKVRTVPSAAFRLETATVALAATGNIGNVSAGYLGNGAGSNDRSLFTLATGFEASTLGDLTFLGANLAPPSLSLASLTGAVDISRPAAQPGTTLYPSPIGQLSILSVKSLSDISIAMLDYDPTNPEAALAVGAVDPLSNQNSGGFPGIDPTVSEQRRRLIHNNNITHLGDFVPARIFTDGSLTNSSINFAKQGSIVAGVDIIDSYIVGQNLGSSDQTRIAAGRDITSTTQALPASIRSQLPFFGAMSIYVGGPGSVSVEAGRDLGPFATSATVKETNGAFSGTSATFGGGIYTVGNEYNPWLPAQGADLSVLYGVQPGVDYATLRETYLNPVNAVKLDGDLFEQVADSQGNLSPDRTRPIYAPILASWLRDNAPALFSTVFSGQSFADEAALTAAAYGKAQALYDAFATLDQKRQQPFLVQNLYFNELEQASLPSSPSFQQYIRGYRAVEALFPARLGYTDNLAAYTTDPGTVTADHPLGVPRRTIVDGQPLVAEQRSTGNADLRFAAIQTARGGDVTILGPGGDFLAGSIVRSSEQVSRRSTRFALSAVPSNLPQYGGLVPFNSKISAIPAGLEGILTLRGGAVRYFSDGDLRLNQSRLFTNATGDISAWSSNGDLNAGQGPKSASNFPPITVRFGLNGLPTVDTAGGIVGAGIGAFKQSPADPNSRIVLIAPVGEVDAGDAGVRATGDVFVAAARVANADNFSAGGTVSGVPSSTVVAAPAVPASAGSALAAIVRNSQPKTGNDDARSLISVDILGYAGGDRCNDPENTDPNCPK